MHPLCYEYLLVIGVCILHFIHNKKTLSVLTRIPRIGCVCWQNRSYQGKFVDFMTRVKGYLKETYKSQNSNPISPTLISH